MFFTKQDSLPIGDAQGFCYSDIGGGNAGGGNAKYDDLMASVGRRPDAQQVRHYGRAPLSAPVPGDYIGRVSHAISGTNWWNDARNRLASSKSHPRALPPVQHPRFRRSISMRHH
jgi:hypothetical protein